MATQWKIEALTTWKDALAPSFQRAWESWYANASRSHVFHSPPLARAWLDAYLPLRNLEPVFLIAQRESTTVFLPLTLWRRTWKEAWRRQVVPVGFSDYDYHDPLVVGEIESVAWSSYWKEVTGFVMAERRFHCHNLTIDGIRPKSLDFVTHRLPRAASCRYIRFSEYDSVEAYLGTLKKTCRKDFLRRLKKLEQRGGVTYRVFAKNESEPALEELERFLDHHASQWPNAYKAPGFHQNIIRRGLPRGMIHFSCLQLDGKSLAWNLNFLDRDALLYYMPALAEEGRSYGAGNILRFYDIRYAFEAGIPIFDFLRGEEPYKRIWAPDATEVFRLGSHRLGLVENARRRAAAIGSRIAGRHVAAGSAQR